MCGINGIISLKNQMLNDNDADICKKMNDLILHRGPNQQGIFRGNNFIFGNTRLFIQDHSSLANLPMTGNTNQFVLAFNGEITNFKELIQKYKLKTKYQFKTHSDSEVLLFLYQELGESMISELNGMFSFAIFDCKLNQIILCRDCFGITPLFYTKLDDKFYFSSEIKSLLEIQSFEREVNEQALYHYLTLAYVPGEETMFKNIYELRNGQKFKINLENGHISKSYHYRMKYEINKDISFKDASNKVHDLILKSVERNLISNSTIGTTLSGGVDTSGITCIINELGKSVDFPTFSIKMGEDSFDESHFQRIVSKKCRTNHHEFLITPEDVEASFFQHLSHLDEPLGNGAPIPIYILAQKASKHVNILLSGEGGDEVFNAYSVYKAWKIKKYYTTFCPKILRRSIYSLVHKLPANYSKLSFDFQAKRFTEGAELHPAAAHFYWRHPLTNLEKDSILKNNSFFSTDQLGINLFNEFSDKDELNRISMLDIEHFITDDLLVKNDRMLYAHSIEGRYPYLDRDLVDFVQTLPTHFKLKGFQGRYIQKHALRKVLPKEILARQNYGLEMPHSIWFFDKLKPLLDRYLNKVSIERTGLFNWESIHKLINIHLSKKKDYGRGLWTIAVFVAWHELYIQSSDYKKYIQKKVIKEVS